MTQTGKAKPMQPERATAFRGDLSGDSSDTLARVARLNARYEDKDASTIIRAAMDDLGRERLAMVSSFGAESVALLHLVAQTDKSIPVLFLDTQMLFAETLEYQRQVAEMLDLQNMRILRAPEADVAARDPYGALHLSDTDACCNLRKTQPLETALTGFSGWISGRKRYQSKSRAGLRAFEIEEATGRVKVNPLLHWGPGEVSAYIDANNLPRHPLVAQGYPSIGCAPCTSKVAAGEDPRSGRWRGQDKEECGIHFVNGRMVRKGAA